MDLGLPLPFSGLMVQVFWSTAWQRAVMDRQDLTVVRTLLISSNEVLSHVFAKLPSIVRMASRGPPFQTPPTISYGQPQTGGSPSTHMVSHRLEVPHQFTWSAFNYATRPLPFIRQLESTTMKGKFPQTAEFRRQRHGQVHPGATGGSTIPDASAAV